MSEPEKGTFFYNAEGERLGSDFGIIPVTLYKGMRITIHSYDEVFEVVEWSYHHGHPDEEAGLRIILKPTGEAAGDFKFSKFRR